MTPYGNSSPRVCPHDRRSHRPTHGVAIAGGSRSEWSSHVVAALVHGSGDERIVGPGCSDRTIRRRVRAWAEAGLAERVHALVLEHYDRLIGLELADLSVDGCSTKAPGGGKAGRSPVDRGK